MIGNYCVNGLATNEEQLCSKDSSFSQVKYFHLFVDLSSSFAVCTQLLYQLCLSLCDYVNLIVLFALNDYPCVSPEGLLLELTNKLMEAVLLLLHVYFWIVVEEDL